MERIMAWSSMQMQMQCSGARSGPGTQRAPGPIGGQFTNMCILKWVVRRMLRQPWNQVAGS